MRLVLTLAIVGMMVALFAGCGGGKKEGPHIHGVASIHSDSLHPTVGLMTAYNNIWQTRASASIPRSTSGWQDKDFKVDLPAPPSGIEVYAILIFNDLDHDSAYDDPGELLGFCDNFLAYRPGYATPWCIENSGYILYADATACTGKNIYIDCPFASMVRGGPTAAQASEAAMATMRGILMRLATQ